ncbi:beta-propeller domain-containing protein [Lentibacillus sediminis]|uniref:beta-propeller domain-containing protein n=1 Tax=Lentibacillus sediminis TaxID=1940529 RepID=UPI000C1BEA73|nr:beta-propeller domain-containing protein [Lentibacillus sediminis]
MKKHLIWFTAAVLLVTAVTMGSLAVFGKPAAELHSPSSYASISQDWTVHFTEPMNPATFTEDTIRITSEEGAKQPVTLEWNEENTILTLKAPASGYELDASYQLTISHKVEAANGKKLANPLSHSFTAAAELEQIENQQQLAQLLKERSPELAREQAEVGVTTTESSMDTAESSAGNAESITSNAASDVSTTNVQVAGIDEGDLIKTDGEYIYFARSSDIVITSADREESTAVSTIAEENFRPAEIYLEGDLLISVGHTYEPIRLEETEPPPGDTIDIAPMPVQQNLTTVHIYDISDKTALEKVREVSLEGMYKTSRKMDGQLYLTASHHPPFQIQQQDDAEARPFFKDTAVQSEGAPVAFEDMYFFPESQENNYLLIASIDLQDLDEEAKVQTYLGASNEFYMSENNIYLAVNQYEKRDISKETNTSMIASPAVNTKIMQFVIDDGAVSYQTSTVVPGRLINQFAMDERDGVFRVATTKGEMWGPPEQEPSTNNLYTFDTSLNPLGKVEGLAEGERIYSVRFMDQVAYMVTFRQVDPLFVIDLSNPQDPEVLGELKIPGFSNYLHPLDEDHVIGFGQHTTLQQLQNGEEPIVRTEGLKISVFDVSDPENPKEKYSKVIGESGSYSELNHDHRALFQQPNSSLYGFPATLFNSETVKEEGMVYENQTLLHQGALLYEITPVEGIVWKDSITHQEADTEFPNEKSRIQRMVSIDGTLYTFSHDQATAYDIALETILGTVQLPEQNQSY